jgi:hypothetical protein
MRSLHEKKPSLVEYDRPGCGCGIVVVDKTAGIASGTLYISVCSEVELVATSRTIFE